LRRGDVKRLSGWFEFVRGLLGSMRLAREVNASRSKRVVVLSNTSAVLSGRLLARRLRVPHVQLVREIYSSGLERIIFGRVIRRSALTVCVSRAAMQQFARIERWPGHVQVVNSGAALLQARPIPRQNSSGTIRIACVGRLSTWKGQSTLLRATALLRDAGHSVSVQIIGGEYGGAANVTADLVAVTNALGLSSIVEFVGEVQDATPHYQWADVVVAPSERPEPFGKVVIEAMNNARPVVASRHGGPAEVLADGRGGALFTPGDARSLADAVLAVSEPGEWQRFSEEAFAKSLRYSESSSGEKIVSLATELAPRGEVHAQR
jgi:glycosyltransferase involved in cell wall biosynthesis